jgi:hypothetical protein
MSKSYNWPSNRQLILHKNTLFNNDNYKPSRFPKCPLNRVFFYKHLSYLPVVTLPVVTVAKPTDFENPI